MVCEIRIFCLMVLALLLPAGVVAQAPPSTKTPVAPKAEQMDPKCAESDTHQSTVGKGGEIETQRQDGKENLSHFHANRYALSKLDLGGVRSLSVGIEFAKVYIFRGNL